MNRDELLDIIRKWIHEARCTDIWFREEDYRIILGRNTRNILITSDLFESTFEHAKETLFGIPTIIDAVYKNRLELVRVCRKEEQLCEDAQ